MLFFRFISRIRSWLTPKPKIPAKGRPRLEPLESRIAPATLISGHLVTYTDTHGDSVSVHSSLPIFTQNDYTKVLTFTAGTTSGQESLTMIDFTSADTGLKVAGDNLSVLITKAASGGGSADVGSIKSGQALGNITVQGDLGSITAGVQFNEPVNYVGLAGLNVKSMGDANTGSTVLVSKISGNVGKVVIQGDMNGVSFSAGTNTSTLKSNGNISSISIGTNLVGNAANNSGYISAAGNIGSVVIGGNMVGGSGTNSAEVTAGGRIGSFTVTDMIGFTESGDTSGFGAHSASILTGTKTGFHVSGGIGKLAIKGNLTGGDGQDSGSVMQASYSISADGVVTVSKSITGGTGGNSGEISGISVHSISVGGGIIGGGGTTSGSIDFGTSTYSLGNYNGSIHSLTISGGITGGINTNAGSVITTSTIGNAVIHGDITGNAAAAATNTGSGQIQAETISSLTLDGSLIGSSAQDSGSIQIGSAGHGIGHLSLVATSTSTGSIMGGSGANSGQISSTSIQSLSIAGEIQGSTGDTSGSVVATGVVNSISIKGAGVLGGSATGSGEISARSIKTLSITGQLEGSGVDSGLIHTSGGGISSAFIGGGIVGGDDGSGQITTGTPTSFGDNIGSLMVVGGIKGGTGLNSGQVSAGGTIGSIDFKGGALQGKTGVNSGTVISTDNIGSVTMGSILIGTGAGSGELSSGGNLKSLNLTGVTGSPTTMNGVVQVAGNAGTITVHGDVLGTTANTGDILIGGNISNLTVTGALRGGTDTESGSVFAGLNGSGTISHATIGDVVGGAGDSSGSVVSYGALGAINITGTSANVAHGLQGGAGANSGQIYSGSTIGSIVIKGDISGNAGNAGTGSGSIVSNSVFSASGDVQGNIGTISVTGSIIGGSATNTGAVNSAGDIKSVTIGGGVTGTAFSGTGAILAGLQTTVSDGGNINTLKIAGALTGANIADNTAGSVAGSGYIEAGHIGSASFGSVHAGSIGANDTVTDDGAILAANDIASLIVGAGGITGDATNSVNITAVGQVSPGKTDFAFGKISVAGDVKDTNFLAGFDQSLTALNGAASIGSVVVNGDWSGSNLIAGAAPLAGNPYGRSVLIAPGGSVIPTIASIIIKGQVNSASPAPGAADTYGFVTGKIGAFTLNGAHENLAVGLIDPVGNSVDTVLRILD